MDHEAARYFRDQLRKGRAAALRDAEGFQEILFVLEKLGGYLLRRIGTLADYRPKIRELANASPLAEDIPAGCPSWHVPFSQLYELVREARNDALHQGALARHLTNSAVQLAFVLEDALMSNRNTVGDYMVREPVCASLWEPLSFIRQKILANSFTYLPVWCSTDWQLLSEYQLARYLRERDRTKRLASTLQDAVGADLKLEEASICSVEAPIDEVLALSQGKPVLVVDGGCIERLVGIVAPFDLL